MPLFSSKFAFKKSPQRRHNLEQNISNEQKEEISSTDSNNEDEQELEEIDEPEQNKTNKSGKQVRQSKKTKPAVNSPKKSKSLANKNEKKKDIKEISDISTQKKLSANRMTKKSKRKNCKANQLTLYLDESQDKCLQFDPVQGSWRNMNIRNDLVPTPNSQTNNKSDNNSDDTETSKRNNDLIDKNKVLEEENRLLKLKIEILMEMVTETTAELNLKEKYTK